MSSSNSLSASSLLARGLRHYKEIPPFTEFGYEAKTTLWGDFGVADDFGRKAIKDTFNRCFEQFKDDQDYGTELAMVLNHKSFQFYSKDKAISQLYTKLFQKLDGYIMSNWKGSKLSYYIKTTD